MQADWISVKIDTVDEVVWKDINRPSVERDLKIIGQMRHYLLRILKVN